MVRRMASRAWGLWFMVSEIGLIGGDLPLLSSKRKERFGGCDFSSGSHKPLVSSFVWGVGLWFRGSA
jgi:hypothetical protein